MPAPAQRRTGLLVIHGIGEQLPGQTRDAVLASLALGYPEAVKRFDGQVGVLESDDFQVRVYEVHWADILSGPAVDGSFKVESIQELVWFPLLNHERLRTHRNLYPRRLVLTWTTLLVVLGALLTAAYYGATFLLGFYAAFRQELTKLGRERRRRKGRFDAALEAATHGRTLNELLDQVGNDVLNYVNAAGGAPAPVQDAEEQIHGRLEKVLKQAVQDDQCPEIQVLAHSLGSVIAFRALTQHRESLSALISLPFDSEGAQRPPVTHFFTIGSPLEKVRFFWPKLLLGGPSIPRSDSRFGWHNFKSPLDPVAGFLARYQLASSIKNHHIRGAGGLFTAHTGYLRNSAFLSVVGPKLTGQPVNRAKLATHRAQRFWGIVGETLGLPALLLALAAAGLLAMVLTGYLAGLAVALPVQWVGDGLGWALAADWELQHTVAVWIRQGFAWLVPLVLIVLAVPLGRSKANRLHRDYWLWQESENGRTTMASEEISTSIEEKAGPKQTNIERRTPGTLWHLLGSVALLVVIAWIGLSGEDRARAWVTTLVLMTAFAVLNGHGITGSWKGILIDSRYKMSLSRLQMLTWTLLVLSALITAILFNVTRGSESPMDIAIPPELWVLLGISTASAVGAPALLNAKQQKKPDESEVNKVVDSLKKQGHAAPDDPESSVVIRNKDIADARWSDLLKGDESGNASAVDLGKLQMFFFTFILVCGYGAAVYTMFLQDGLIEAFPAVQEGMNVLLGISQTGYLATKAVTQSKEKTS